MLDHLCYIQNKVIDMHFFILFYISAVFVFELSHGNSYCMSDCNTQRQPSIYQQYCCNMSNIGNSFKFKDGNLHTYIICPIELPASCLLLYNNFSCADIHQNNPGVKSGYYNITLTNGSTVSVYCDMEGINCDGEGGWTRVAYINMSESGTTCPPGLIMYEYDNIDHGVCGRSTSSSGGCNSAVFSSYGIKYKSVCGQIRGYMFASPDGFGGSNIDSPYVDGISITFDSLPRQHIWTYAAIWSEYSIDCPCLNIPAFVGSDYYCEFYSTSPEFRIQKILHPDNPLWDMNTCNISQPCCTIHNKPWFIKTLNEAITENIELRDCSNQSTNDEDILLDIIEIFVK